MRFALPAKLPQGFSHGLLILLEPLRWEPQALFAMPGKIKSKIKIKSDKVCLAGPPPQKTKIPTGLAPGRDQSWGWEFAMLSFPGRHLAPKGLPASRRYSPRQAELRPHSRAVQRLAVAEF